MNHDGNRFKISITFEPSNFESVEELDALKQLFAEQGDRLQPLNAGGDHFGDSLRWCEMWFIFESPYDAENLHDLAVKISILCGVPLNPVLKNLCEVGE